MSLQACAEVTRKGDPDRFLAAMAAPPAARARLLPLYAFNVEISRAPWASDEPLIAQMRLQFWHDTLERIAAGQEAGGHEIAAPLAQLIRAQDLPAAVLGQMVAARLWDIERAPFADAAAFEAHMAATAGNLMWLSALALGADRSDEPALRRLGGGQGVANWLRAAPALQARGCAPFLDARPAAVAALARQALEQVQGARRETVSRLARPAMRAAWLAVPTLARAARHPDLVATGGLELSGFRRKGTLLMLALSGRGV